MTYKETTDKELLSILDDLERELIKVKEYLAKHKDDGYISSIKRQQIKEMLEEKELILKEIS